MIGKGVCDKRFTWNPCNCECECYKSCDFSEYLDYRNCKCEKKFVNKLVEECTRCMLCRYWYSKDIGFKLKPHVCNKCDDILMTAYELKNIAILNLK